MILCLGLRKSDEGGKLTDDCTESQRLGHPGSKLFDFPEKIPNASKRYTNFHNNNFKRRRRKQFLKVCHLMRSFYQICQC